MAAYDNKLLNGEHLSYLINLIKTADAATAASIPDSLDDLTDDATHRLVTDTEKAGWDAKADTSDIPTAVSDLTNDSGFQTATQVTAAINSAIAGLTTFHFEVVQSLPLTDQDTSAIYLVPKSSASTNNVYEEWAWVKTGTDPQTSEDVYGWEHLGDTQVDLAVLSNTEIQTIWDSVT